MITLSAGIQHEVNQLFVGRLIAKGSYREVYESNLNRETVLKFELRDTGRFCNVHEWSIWKDASESFPEVARWLAPCHAISYGGTLLIQARTTPIEELSPELPDFLTDLKLKNFGRFEGRIVAHDYGNHRLFDKGMRRVRMRKVEDRRQDW